MPPGKLAAQVGHAVHLALKLLDSDDMCVWDRDLYRILRHKWELNSYPKIVLRVDDSSELTAIHGKLSEVSIPHVLVVDEGRTVTIPGTVTAIGIVPISLDERPKFLKRLRLY